MSKKPVKKRFLAIARVREKGKFVGFKITKQSHVGDDFEEFEASNGLILHASSYPEPDFNSMPRSVYLRGHRKDCYHDIVLCTKEQYIDTVQAVKEYNLQDEKPKPIRAMVKFSESDGIVHCLLDADAHEVGCTIGIEKFLGARIPRNTTFTVRITEVTKKKSRKANLN